MDTLWGLSADDGYLVGFVARINKSPYTVHGAFLKEKLYHPRASKKECNLGSIVRMLLSCTTKRFSVRVTPSYSFAQYLEKIPFKSVISPGNRISLYFLAPLS